MDEQLRAQIARLRRPLVLRRSASRVRGVRVAALDRGARRMVVDTAEGGHMSRATPTSRTVRRLPIVVVLVVALVVAAMSGNATTKPARELPPAENAAAVDTTGASSRAWFCPGFPAPVALPTQTLTVTNTGDATASVATTVYRDDGAASATRTFDV